MHENVRKAHKALGCQDFSIYDIRVDPEGNMFFLEASLYCSFAPKSAIVLMAHGTDDIKHQELFRTMLRNGANRGKYQASMSTGAQKSMKGKVLP